MADVATHPLAEAASRAGRQTDAVIGAQRQGEAADQRVAALSALTEGNAAAEAELVATRRQLGEAAGQQESGATKRYWKWYRGQMGAIRAHAVRLGFDPEALNLRGPAWRPL